MGASWPISASSLPSLSFYGTLCQVLWNSCTDVCCSIPVHDTTQKATFQTPHPLLSKRERKNVNCDEFSLFSCNKPWAVGSRPKHASHDPTHITEGRTGQTKDSNTELLWFGCLKWAHRSTSLYSLYVTPASVSPFLFWPSHLTGKKL